MKKRSLPIDFAQAYRDYMDRIGFEVMSAQAWDERADGMNQGALESHGIYSQAFLGQLDLNKVDTVLDVSCGPGLLALQIAPHVRTVYGLDHSQNMLRHLQNNASILGLKNIVPIQLAKEEAWEPHAVPVCDIVICSRGGVDGDIEWIVKKLSRYAKQRVYFSTLVGGHFDNSGVYEFLGRAPEPPFPDYIYLINVLYQLGYNPNVSFVNARGRLYSCQNEADFMQRMQRQFKDLRDEEVQRLHAFYRERHQTFTLPEYGTTWALVNWVVE